MRIEPAGFEHAHIINDAMQEVMYYRVAYIPNPWYDDHFDVPTEPQRIGKTLTMIATAGDDLSSRGSLLVGWALYQKLDKVLALMTQWVEDNFLSSAVTASMVCVWLLSLYYLKLQFIMRCYGRSVFCQFICMSAHCVKTAKSIVSFSPPTNASLETNLIHDFKSGFVRETTFFCKFQLI